MGLNLNTLGEYKSLSHVILEEWNDDRARSALAQARQAR